METQVHYPTDINLLFDALRKVIFLLAALCAQHQCRGWRQQFHNVKQAKRLFRKAQKIKHSTSKDPEVRQKREREVQQAYQAYLDLAEGFMERAQETLDELHRDFGVPVEETQEIEGFLQHALRQRDQVQRRVMDGETIPHDEKVFSVFEEHTEWICKGKAGVPVELGIRIAILEDQYGFIVHHHVMQQQTDDQVAVFMVQQAQKAFPDLKQCSFDKGFHTPDNQVQLRHLLQTVILPKKGKLSLNDQQREYHPDFIQARHQHAAVESAINALEVHGLDRCPDHGINGLKRYVSLAVLARNIQQIGAYLQKREKKYRFLKKVA